MMNASCARFAALLCAAGALSACAVEGNPESTGAAAYDSTALAAATNAMTTESLLQRIRVLADDSMEGRAPGTPGEEKTVRYLISEFEQLGLQPGNPAGGWTQDVPLVGFTSRPTASFNVQGSTMSLTPLQDFVAVSRHFVPEVDVESSEMVFVGYGVVAPEFGWDDYKDVDVSGKTIVMLINDPAVPAAGDSAALDENMFRGQAMTYYGRWTYKYEIASEKGAAAAIIVHETGPAGYGFEVVSGSWGRENFDIRTPGGNEGRVQVEGWITTDVARDLFTRAGLDFADLKRQALSRDFRPVPLPNTTATLHVENTVREVQSKNVVALLPGSDSELSDEYVIYSAHWDHLGRDSTLQGDQIFNGALDNASGTAGMLEIARAFTALPEPPRRSIVFLAVTAEEKGLLGAKYYAENPLYPLARTAANINMDGISQWGRTSDIVVIGSGNTSLEDILREEAAAQGRTVAPDPEPEKGFFYRSDHFEFAKQGVPALYTDVGTQYVGRDAGYGQQKRDEYTAQDYHGPSDDIKSDWDLTGGLEDLALLFRVGVRVAQTDTLPVWKEGTEFKARREASLQQQQQ